MADKYEERAKKTRVHACGNAYGNPACGCMERQIAQALRDAHADGILEGVAIGGIAPTIAARRRAAALRAGAKGDGR